MEHAVSHHGSAVFVSFQHASGPHMEMTVSRSRFYIDAVFSERFVGGKIHMFYFKPWHVIEIDDGSVDDVFRLNDAVVVYRSHKQLDCHPVYIVTADKTPPLHFGNTALLIFQHILLVQYGMLHIEDSGKLQNLAVFNTDQLLFHIETDAKPVRQGGKLSHKCLGFVKYTVDVEVREGNARPLLEASADPKIPV